MDQNVFKRFLKDRYFPALQHARQRAVHHQRIAKGLEWAFIILSAIISMRLTLSSFLKVLPITPIVAIVTVIASLMKLLKFSALRARAL